MRTIATGFTILITSGCIWIDRILVNQSRTEGDMTMHRDKLGAPVPTRPYGDIPPTFQEVPPRRAAAEAAMAMERLGPP
jgi:hypothetical protein